MGQQENVYQTPESALEAEAVSVYSDELASRWRRLFAAIIDSIIAMVFSIPLMMYLGYWDQFMQGQQPSILETYPATIAGIMFFLIVHGYLLKTQGQTIGKAVLGIRIVDMNGNLLPIGKLIGLRLVPIWVAAVIPIIGQIATIIDTLFIFRSDKRCVHDLIAGSQVVNK